MSPAAIARWAAAITGAGVGKSGSPISMCTTERPAASSARAAVCTSMTWNGAISATRAAVAMRDSIESLSAGQARKRYRTASRLAYRTNVHRHASPSRRSLGGLRARHRRAPLRRCTSAPTGGNAVVYQDEPCPTGRELRNFAADPATVSVLPMRPAGHDDLASRPPPPPAKNRARRRSARRRCPWATLASAAISTPACTRARCSPGSGRPIMKSGGSGRKVSRWTYMPDARRPANDHDRRVRVRQGHRGRAQGGRGDGARAMRALVQRVREASVTVDGTVVGRHRPGAPGPCGGHRRRHRRGSRLARPQDRAAARVRRRRRRDEPQRNRYAAATILAVSQFTLYASTRKGNRPSYTAAARPEVAEPAFAAFVAVARGGARQGRADRRVRRAHGGASRQRRPGDDLARFAAPAE